MTMEDHSLDDLLKPAEVRARTTLSAMTIWRKVRDGSFPRPLKISANRIAWRAADIATWRGACDTSGTDAGNAAA